MLLVFHEVDSIGFVENDQPLFDVIVELVAYLSVVHQNAYGKEHHSEELADHESEAVDVHLVVQSVVDQVCVILVDDPDLAIDQFEFLVQEAVVVEEGLWITDNHSVEELDEHEFGPWQRRQSQVEIDQHAREEHSDHEPVDVGVRANKFLDRFKDEAR